MEILRDLTSPKLQQSWASEVRARLRVDNYGIDWCVTDILREPNRLLRLRVIDALLGTGTNGKPTAARVPVSVTLRRIGHGTITVTVVDGEPELLCYDAQGQVQMHPSGRQTRHAVQTLPERWSCPLASDIPLESAILMLRLHGWMAKDGGRERRRYSQVGVQEFRDGRYVQASLRAVDHWVIVEEAFERMHPEMAPPADRARAAPTAAEPVAASSAAERDAEIARQRAEFEAKQARREAGRRAARKRWAAKKAAQGTPPAE